MSAFSMDFSPDFDSPFVPQEVEPSPEVLLNRQNTEMFIAADPIDLELWAKVKTPKDDGGFSLALASDPRPTQTFRLIPQGDVMAQVQTPDGIQLIPTYVLLGTWDCDMERWDEFELNSLRFCIVSPIRPDFRTPEYWYERKADVARF